MKTMTRPWSGLIAALLMMSTLASRPATAATITFDDVTAPALFGGAQALTTQYAAFGVTFNGTGAVLDQDGGFGVTGFSPRNVLAYEEQGFIGAPGPSQATSMASDVLTLSTPVSFVSFLAGTSLTGRTLDVRAFSASNALISTQTLALSSALQLISVSGSSIARIEYALTNADLGDGFVVDNVTVGAAPVPEPATLLLLGTGLLSAGFVRKRRS